MFFRCVRNRPEPYDRPAGLFDARKWLGGPRPRELVAAPGEMFERGVILGGEAQALVLGSAVAPETGYALVHAARCMVGDALAGVEAAVAAVRDALAAGDLDCADESLQVAGRFQRAAVAWSHDAGDLAMAVTDGGRGPDNVVPEIAERYVAAVFAFAAEAVADARQAERLVDAACGEVGQATPRRAEGTITNVERLAEAFVKLELGGSPMG